MAKNKGLGVRDMVSVSVTWVDGRIIFKTNVKWSNFYYGVCKYSEGVFAVTPLDFDAPTLITTIIVDPIQKYCDQAGSCLNLNCKLNRFNIPAFLTKFKDTGSFSLGLPNDFGKNDKKKDTYNWFNCGAWKDVWKKFIIPETGGTLRYSESKAMLAQNSPIIIPN